MPDQTSPSAEQTTTPDPAPADEMASLLRQADASERAANSFYVDARAALRERDAVRAELARVRPVVDAARAAGDAWSEHDLRAVGPALDDLSAAVAALDGDAATTPQPADMPDIRLAPDGSVWRGLGTRWVQLLSSGAHHLTPPADAVRLARASSAPPVDVTARVRASAHAAFTAMDKGVLMSETGDGAESVLAVGHLHLIAEYLERHPDWPSAQAIVRALATPTTDTPGGNR